MLIQSIVADRTSIRFLLDEAPLSGSSIIIRAFSPAVTETPVLIGSVTPDVKGEGKILVLPRIISGKDGLTLTYRAEVNGAPVGGIRYIDHIEDSLRNDPYPVADSKKGLQISDPDDARVLGVRHSAININQGDIMMLTPEEGDTMPYEYDGETYYFRRSRVEIVDNCFRRMTENGIILTMILLNSHHWRIQTPDDLWAVIRHPHYDEEGRISAFNVETEDGVRFYRAFIAFLTDRYAREDAPFGRAVGMIISNEVDAQWIWGNAGEMTMEQYMTEYATAMRLAYQTAADIYENMRIYISLDHFWAKAMNDQSLRFYASRDMLEFMNRLFREEGDIPWNIAFHPYPEDLNFPDFWNDPNALPDDDTPIITFKNLEVLARFVHRPDLLYRGEVRRIILSEQGFNSHWTEESEVLQAAAYGHAYRKVMEIPEIDSFILHAHLDNMYEFGLSLGLWRRKKDSNEPDAPKPIYAVFKAIDKKDEKGVYHWERY